MLRASYVGCRSERDSQVGCWRPKRDAVDAFHSHAAGHIHGWGLHYLLEALLRTRSLESSTQVLDMSLLGLQMTPMFQSFYSPSAVKELQMEQHPDVVCMVIGKMETGEGRLSTILAIPEAPTLVFLLSLIASTLLDRMGLPLSSDCSDPLPLFPRSFPLTENCQLKADPRRFPSMPPCLLSHNSLLAEFCRLAFSSSHPPKLKTQRKV